MTVKKVSMILFLFVIQNIRNRFFRFDILTNHDIQHLEADIYGDYIGITQGIGLIDDYHLSFGDFFMISSKSDIH